MKQRSRLDQLSLSQLDPTNARIKYESYLLRDARIAALRECCEIESMIGVFAEEEQPSPELALRTLQAMIGEPLFKHHHHIDRIQSIWRVEYLLEPLLLMGCNSSIFIPTAHERISHLRGELILELRLAGAIDLDRVYEYRQHAETHRSTDEQRVGSVWYYEPDWIITDDAIDVITRFINGTLGHSPAVFFKTIHDVIIRESQAAILVARGLPLQGIVIDPDGSKMLGPDSFPANGPIPPDSFCWNRTRHNGLTRMQFCLLEALWDREKPASLPDIREALWGSRSGKQDMENVRRHYRAINDFFEKHKIPLEMIPSNHFLTLKQIEPNTVASTV